MLRILSIHRFLGSVHCSLWMFLLLGCGSGNNDAKNEHTDNAHQGGQPIESTSRSKPGERAGQHHLAGADDEIVPVLNPIPPSLAEDRVLPEDPAAFRRQVIETLKKDPSADVIAQLDVVLLLNPDDQEIREIRANVLLRQGLAEDAAVDLKHCCAKGRASCCR